MDVPERWWSHFVALVILLAVPLTAGSSLALIWFEGLAGWSWRDEALAGLLSVVVAVAAAVLMRAHG